MRINKTTIKTSVIRALESTGPCVLYGNNTDCYLHNTQRKQNVGISYKLDSVYVGRTTADFEPYYGHEPSRSISDTGPIDPHDDLGL
jgi:hypothetical protein